jgi:hypothetical protein
MTMNRLEETHSKEHGYQLCLAMRQTSEVNNQADLFSFILLEKISDLSNQADLFSFILLEKISDLSKRLNLLNANKQSPYSLKKNQKYQIFEK